MLWCHQLMPMSELGWRLKALILLCAEGCLPAAICLSCQANDCTHAAATDQLLHWVLWPGATSWSLRFHALSCECGTPCTSCGHMHLTSSRGLRYKINIVETGGDGPKLALLQSMVASNCLQGRVQLLGAVPHRSHLYHQQFRDWAVPSNCPQVP